MKWISLWLAILMLVAGMANYTEENQTEKIEPVSSSVPVSSVVEEEEEPVEISLPAEVVSGWENLYPIGLFADAGYITLAGEVVLPRVYYRAMPFNNGLARVIEQTQENSYCFINAKGEKQFGVDFFYASEFNNGRATVLCYDWRWRVIDIENNVVYLLDENVESAYDGYQDGMLCVRFENGKYGYYNEFGGLVIAPQWDMGGNFGDGLAAVINYKEKMNYIDKTGKIVIKTEADTDDPLVHFDNYEFSEGLAYVGDGYINKKGDYAIRFDWGLKDGGGRPFYEGVALVYTNEKLYFINKNGEVVIDISQYSSAGDFINGMAWISDGFGFGFINKKGEVVIEPGFYVPGDWPDENFFECQFTVDGFYQGIYMGKDDSWEGYIDTQGNIIYKD